MTMPPEPTVEELLAVLRALLGQFPRRYDAMNFLVDAKAVRTATRLLGRAKT